MTYFLPELFAVILSRYLYKVGLSFSDHRFNPVSLFFVVAIIQSAGDFVFFLFSSRSVLIMDSTYNII